MGDLKSGRFYECYNEKKVSIYQGPGNNFSTKQSSIISTTWILNISLKCAILWVLMQAYSITFILKSIKYLIFKSLVWAYWSNLLFLSKWPCRLYFMIISNIYWSAVRWLKYTYLKNFIYSNQSGSRNTIRVLFIQIRWI